MTWRSGPCTGGREREGGRLEDREGGQGGRREYREGGREAVRKLVP